MAVRFRERVAADVLDGEAMIISFETGKYYAARGMAGSVVRGVIAGASPESIAKRMSEAAGTGGGGVPAEEVPARVEEVLSKLRSEGLVEEDGEESEWRPDRGPYERPSIEVFEDVAETLSVDPVHDSESWPTRRGTSR